MLPSTIKKEASEDANTPGSSSYKKKKESKDKANSSRCFPPASLWALGQASATLALPFPRRLGMGSLGWVQHLVHDLAKPVSSSAKWGELWWCFTYVVL